MGRMLNHELGFRPYKCYLVWQERDAKQRFKEIKRIELMPVRVRLTSEFTRIKWTLSNGGSRPDGFLQLEDVSPNQVSEADLRGQLDGRDPPDGVEFFYEIVKQPRCAGEVAQTIRCALQSVPFLDAAKFMYVVDLKDQAVVRKPETEVGDRDNTHKPASKKKHDVIKF